MRDCVAVTLERADDDDDADDNDDEEIRPKFGLASKNRRSPDVAFSGAHETEAKEKTTKRNCERAASEIGKHVDELYGDRNRGVFRSGGLTMLGCSLEVFA